MTLQVVDMFGCGLPVCAASYQCIGELVSHGHNGLLFTCAEELARHLADVLEGFPGKPSQLLQVIFLVLNVSCNARTLCLQSLLLARLL